MAPRIVLIVLLYAAAFLFIWVGTDLGPVRGWPTTPTELNGCAALIIGLILKFGGHVALLRRN